MVRSHTGSGEAVYPEGAFLTVFQESWLLASLLPQGWQECRGHLLCALHPSRVWSWLVIPADVQLGLQGLG